MRTLAGPASFSTEIQKSRFLARAVPLPDAALAEAMLCSIAIETASHHCWAWRHGQRYRFHDAEEPSGSAGKPILAAIDGAGLDRVLVVVTRWFGGIKLGVGGLVRAYGGSAAECLRNAAQVEIVAYASVEVEVGFDHTNGVYHLLRQLEACIEAERYSAAGLHLRLRLPAAAVSNLCQRIRDLSRGSGRVRVE